MSLLSIIFLSLATCGILSNSIIGTALGQVDVGVEGETEIKIGEGSDEEQDEVSVEGETETSAEVKVETSSESEQKYSEKTSETGGGVESETQAQSQTQLNIKTSYPKIKTSSENSFTVQTQQMLYKPGDMLRVEGSVWSNLMAQLGGTNMITIQVLDSKGTLVKESNVQMKSDGNFDAEVLLPTSVINGEYTIKSKIVTDSSILGVLSAETKSNLESTTKVMVFMPSTVKIKVQGHDDFEVKVASNSKVSKIEFKEPEKKVTLMVEGETGTKGVTQVSIPKALLSGQMSVMIDGKVMASDDVIVTTNTEATTTLELNYHHSTHTIDIVGTNAVPEFGALASIILVVAISGIVVLSTKYGNFGIRKI
ncbi:MAG: MG2 domain-containing protein [Nitrososphaerales archaeon]